ncbi:hypothetical protein N799_01010 [Lysobacter arseniciresistens ZS79]|uniref:HMA domain-containing protein n=1 Tax=Lysobacter arseniciresistens ZS79 TaxID=913325 RepID=A0A0A0F3T4_9GAMM|nr:hypothetical protein [Lysobacter arseniciresistens]KGM57776.1 hypothetical protein N799_01010 [Lysobacter arseniciresistens ZS79]
MEFHVTAKDAGTRLPAIEDAILDIDPAAVVDIDADGVLRVAAALDAGELERLLTATGMTLAPGDVHQLPSICCGGCSG